MVAKEQSGPRAFSSTFADTFRSQSRERLSGRNWVAILAVAVAVSVVVAIPDLINRSFSAASGDMLTGAGLTLIIALLQRPSQSPILSVVAPWVVVAAIVAVTVFSRPRTPSADQRALLLLAVTLCASIALIALRRRT